MNKIPTNTSEKAKWFYMLIDPSHKCRNLRAFCKNIFGCKLEKNQYWALRDMLDPKIRLIYLSNARQCLAGESLVLLKNGKILPIKDIPSAWKTGKKKTYLIETRRGKQITCTLKHRFMTKIGWKTMEEIIKKGLKFEVPDFLPYPKNIKCDINNNRLKILGYLLSDGFGFLKYGQSIKFTNTNKLYLKEFENLIKVEFPSIVIKSYKKGNGYDLLCTAGKKSYKTNELQAWITTLTFIGNFPIELMGCNKKQVASFLSRLYAGDGWASCKNRQREIGLGDDNLYFIRYIQLLLHKFGIHALYQKEKSNKMYKLRIQNKISIERFFNITLIYGKEKACKKVKENIKKIYKKRSNPSPYRDKKFDGVKKVSQVGFIETYDMEVLPEHYYYANGIKVHNSGKTHVIALFQAIAAIFPEFIIPNYEGVGNAYVFAPKKEQAEISFERFSNFVHFNDYNIYSNSIVTDKYDRIIFRNGFEVRAITASRNAEIEGLTSFIIIADESQAISPYKFRESIAPMGGGVKGGAKIIQCGVPGVLGSHFHRAYKNKFDPQTNSLGYIHHVYPWQDCPRLDLNYIMRLKNEDPDSFERNYELKWERSNYGYFITYEEYEVCEENYDPYEMHKKAIEENWPMYWSIDFAKLRDSTVVFTIAQNPKNGHFYVVGNILEFRGTEYIDQIGYIKNAYIPGHIKHTCADKSSVGEMPVETLNDGGILTTGINFNLQSKDRIYKNLRNKIQQKLIHWPKKLPNKEYRKFKQQLLELEIEYKTTGLISVHHNLDDNLAHDDYPDGLCLAVWAATEYVEPNISFI